MSTHAVYEARIRGEEARVSRLEARSLRYSRWRLAVFLLGLGCAVVGAREFGNLDPPWLFVSLGLFVGFGVLVRRHGGVARELDAARGLVALNREALDRLARRWEALPLPAEVAPSAMARDLDLFGRASLFQLLGTVRTPPGRATMSAWLRAPADASCVAQRLEAARERAPELDARQAFELEARAAAASDAHAERFLEWAEAVANPPPPARVLLARLWTGLLPLVIAAEVVGWVAWPLWLPCIAVNLALTTRGTGRWHPRFAAVEAREGEYQAYRRLLELMESTPARTPLTASLTARVRGAARALDRLHALSGHSQLRRSMMYLPVQVLTLWDVHVDQALRRWQARHGRDARDWLAALGEFEAVNALAALRRDHPDWCEPERRDTPGYDARGLGHPLLAPERCVTNDVSLGEPGSFLLVTGSNMSGKSTLLRAIGLNAVLAGMGSVVCAERFAWFPLPVATSMRVEDSLARGVSQYMAELERLKEVVDAARAAEAVGSRVLFLLDEILRGTNSAERQIAVRRVLGHLLAHGAMGAISTHDLDLAEVPELRDRARRVHFQETYHPGQDPPMTFDYRLREGVATSTNALTLLRMVGLDDTEP